MNYVTGFLLIIYGVGLVYFFKKALKCTISPSTHFVLVNAKNTKSVENTIRAAIKKYPLYDIYVINCGDGEMRRILECMMRDFPFIHIIEKSSSKK